MPVATVSHPAGQWLSFGVSVKIPNLSSALSLGLSFPNSKMESVVFYYKSGDGDCKYRHTVGALKVAAAPWGISDLSTWSPQGRAHRFLNYQNRPSWHVLSLPHGEPLGSGILAQQSSLPSPSTDGCAESHSVHRLP